MKEGESLNILEKVTDCYKLYDTSYDFGLKKKREHPVSEKELTFNSLKSPYMIHQFIQHIKN